MKKSIKILLILPFILILGVLIFTEKFNIPLVQGSLLCGTKTNICSTSNYKVETSLVFNQAPSAENLAVNEGDYCTAPLHPTFSWTFTDSDSGDTQSAYQVQADNNSDFSSPEIDSGKVLSASESYTPANPVEYNTTYYWQVKVWDSQDEESSWIEGPSFTTPLHPYPSPAFVSIPSSPAIDQVTRLCTTHNFSWGDSGTCLQNESICYIDENSTTTCADQTYTWILPEGVDFASSTIENPENPDVVFSANGTYFIELRIRDNVGECPFVGQVDVGYSLPKWKEVEP